MSQTETRQDVSNTELEYGRDVIHVSCPDGTARLLNLNGEFYAISEIADIMLRQSLSHGPLAAAQEISKRYGTALPEVQTDLDHFLNEVIRVGLIRRRSVSRKCSASKALALLILAPAFYVAHHAPLPLNARAWILLAITHYSLRLFGWTRTREFCKRFHETPDPRLSQGLWERTVTVTQATVRAVAAKHLLRVDCKERSLCCWTLLRTAGLPASLVIGVRLFPLLGHCWCESNSTLSDDREECEQFTPVVQYK